MTQYDVCEILDILRESTSTKDWSLVDEAIMYLKDQCHECDEENED